MPGPKKPAQEKRSTNIPSPKSVEKKKSTAPKKTVKAVKAVKAVSRHKRAYRDNINSITKPALQRLAKQAGVKYMSGLNYNELRSIIYDHLEHILENVANIMKGANQLRMSTNAVLYELARAGYKYYPTGAEENMKACRPFSSLSAERKAKRAANKTNSKTSPTNSTASSTTKLGGAKSRFRKETHQLRQIRYAQKTNHDCYNITKTGFTRLLREILHKFLPNTVQLSANATGVLLHHTDMYVVKLLEQANLCAIHRKSTTVKPKDILLVVRLQNRE